MLSTFTTCRAIIKQSPHPLKGETYIKIEIAEKAKSVLSNRESFHNYFAWPTVTRLHNGNLAAVASGYRLRHVCHFGKCVISYSFNEGKSWTRPAPVIDTPLDDRDAGIAVSGNRVILTSFNNDVKMQRNRNNDKTQAYYHSKKESYVDAYLDKVTESDAEKKYLGSVYTVSEDGGETWQTDLIIHADEVDPDVGYPASVELENGDILTVFYAHPEKGLPCEICQTVWRITE